jgi:probable F420-dependent oxidoreductase
MSTPLPPEIPQLSVGLRTFSADDPGGWESLFDRARLLDRVGIDRLLVSDHVVFGEHLDAYGRPETGGVAGGVQPTGPDGHWLEPLTTLAVLAGMTSRIRLGTNIMIAALRRPVVLAKSAATLDVLSGGRLDLGVGVGWQREEYESAGLDFDRRGRLLDETLEVCQTLWRDTRASFRSDALEFEGIHQMPKPLQPGGVPLWISGRINPAVVRRVARFGSGWIPWGDDAADLAASLPRLRDLLEAAGRDPSDLLVAGQLPEVRDADGNLDVDATMASVPGLVAAGVTDLRASLRIPADAAAAEDHLRRVVAAFRTAVGRSTEPDRS